MVNDDALDGIEDDTSFALGDADIAGDLDDDDPAVENLALDGEDTTPVGDDGDFDSRRTLEHDTGDLYGVVTQQAVDNVLTASEANDGFIGAGRGQNWFEALEASAAENGALPERAIDVEDELDRPGASRTRKDVPIADAGVGGPAGR
jgi:hypothetical protein